MREQFFNSEADLAWLREVHLAKLSNVPEFRSAVLRGNEDDPVSVKLYAAKEPNHDELPEAEYTFDKGNAARLEAIRLLEAAIHLLPKQDRDLRERMKVCANVMRQQLD